MPEKERRLTTRELFNELYGRKNRTKDGYYDDYDDDDNDDDDDDCYCE